LCESIRVGAWPELYHVQNIQTLKKFFDEG
jgi:hypothetical protein